MTIETFATGEAMPRRIEASEWPELCYRLGLTDGLPTFPPERDVVARLVAGSGLSADHSIGAIPPSGRAGTVEAIAANAAMAGCLPEHMPIVLAALEAMLEPRFNLAGVVTTTHPCWPLVIVSGPVVRALGFATQESVFSGGGARANLAIGRAVRLVSWNLGGAQPRRPVQEILGHPGRLAYCLAEEPENTPWPSFVAERGSRPAEAPSRSSPARRRRSRISGASPRGRGAGGERWLGWSPISSARGATRIRIRWARRSSC